ncbi:MAG: hypothetical protein OSA49_10490 [Ascidiaceihabitans sp.]|nr:hypothetical protein [Ascidiaceihabitans sp.]
MTENRDLLEVKVVEVLRKHFEEASDYDINIEAMRVTLPLKIGTKAEYTRQWKTLIRGEIKNIRKLQALTIETTAIIEKLHSSSLIQIANAWSPLDGKERNVSEYRNSINEIKNKISELTCVLHLGEQNIKDRYPQHETEMGRERKDGATMCAYMAGLSFFYLKDKRPTVIYDPYEEASKGPFLDLVSDLFFALNIEANAEASARKAAKSFRKETHPVTGAFLPLFT